MKNNVIELIDYLKYVCENSEEYINDISKRKKIIGCFLEYTPMEIIHSLGFHPLGLWGENIDIVNSSKYLPSFFCYPLQSILEKGIQGKYEYLSAVVIPSLCDSLKAIGQNWKIAVEDIKFIPVVYPQNRKLASGLEFLESEYINLIKELEQIGEVKFEPQALIDSIEIYNRRSIAINKLMAVIEDHLDIITPIRRHYINKSSQYMDVEEHLRYIEMIIEELDKLPKIKSDNKRIILTGIMADSPILLNALGENKLDVIADDLAQESRQFRITVEVDKSNPLKSYCNKWRDLYGCALAYTNKKERISMLSDLIDDKKADGLIFVNTAFCDPEEYDYPIIRKVLNEKNTPHIFLQITHGEIINEQIKTRVQAFTEILY